MADIRFTGFVEEVLEGRNGPYGLKIAEGHSKKDDNDRWVTAARTYHRVKAAYGAGINFANFAKGDRVDVVGKQVTDPYTDQQGKKQYPLVVKADSVTVAQRGQQAPQAPAYGGDSYGDDTPF